MGDSAQLEKESKTKLLLSVKSELTDIKQEFDVEKGQIEKLQKRLAQVGPALDGILYFIIKKKVILFLKLICL